MVDGGIPLWDPNSRSTGMRRPSRTRSSGIAAGVLIAALALVVPTIALAANFTVAAIPGGGWVQAPETTANAVIATSPAAGLGTSSLRLTSTVNTDRVGAAREIVGPLSGLTGASWMTYATGTSSILVSEPAALKFTMFRLAGGQEFTTMVVERVYNETVTAGTWQTTNLEPDTVVWQTSGPGFCDQTTFCEFSEFKAQYPNATLLGLQVAIGTGIPATTSYVDGVSRDHGQRSHRHLELRAGGGADRDASARDSDPGGHNAPDGRRTAGSHAVVRRQGVRHPRRRAGRRGAGRHAAAEPEATVAPATLIVHR